jgi:hypothetical protein
VYPGPQESLALAACRLISPLDLRPFGQGNAVGDIFNVARNASQFNVQVLSVPGNRAAPHGLSLVAPPKVTPSRWQRSTMATPAPTLASCSPLQRSSVAARHQSLHDLLLAQSDKRTLSDEIEQLNTGVSGLLSPPPRAAPLRNSAPALFRGAWRKRPASAQNDVLSSDACKGPVGLNLLHEPSEARVDFIFVRLLLSHLATLISNGSQYHRYTVYAEDLERHGASIRKTPRHSGQASGFRSRRVSNMCESTASVTIRTGQRPSTAL